jgi:hypothetical protein
MPGKKELLRNRKTLRITALHVTDYHIPAE